MKQDADVIIDFLFEVGILAQTPRSGFHFLGSGRQSVAEHVHRVMHVGFVLGMMENNVDLVRDPRPTGSRGRRRRPVSNGVDMAKILQMCLFHDLSEARTSDLNYVHQKYAKANHKKVMKDLAATFTFGKHIRKIVDEYEARQSRESFIAKDADNIEWILSLKEQLDTGNSRAGTWIPSAIKRLKTASAKKLAKRIVKINSDHWWFSNKNDEWWVSRGTGR